MSDNLMQILAQMQPKKEIHSLLARTDDKIVLIPLTDIAYFEAEDKYVFLCMTERQKHLTNHTLSTLSEKLPDTFLRVSRRPLSIALKSPGCTAISTKNTYWCHPTRNTPSSTGSTYTDAIRQLLKL